MRKIQINEQILSKWIYDFIKDNNNTPGLRDLYRYKGCPYSKETILNEYGNLNVLYEKLNISRKSVGYNNISDEKLLKELFESVIKYKTTDRDILRQNGLYDRTVYEKRFNSWSNSLKLAGINNTVKTLLKYFDNYQGQNPIQFLKQEIGVNNEFTKIQLSLMNKAKELGYDSNKIRKSINYKVIKENFITVSLILIACGKEPTTNYCSGNKYIANDNHVCDSNCEVIIDNYLSSHNILHEVHKKYPNSKMKCDFYINDTYVEYAGLMEHKKYQLKIQKKIEFAKENNLKQIIIYKKDLNRLSELLGGISE